MIKIFRTIRQRMLKENRFSRYFLYAIGEIVLVVIGILIALQINLWNEQRKLAKEEQLVLIQLRTDFRSDLEQLEGKIASGVHIVVSSAAALRYMDNPVGVQRDSLIKELGAILGWPTFKATKNDMSTTGRLQLIRNPELRSMLSNWPTEVTRVQETEQEIKSLYLDVILPFTIDFGIAREMVISYYGDTTNLGFLLDKRPFQHLHMARSVKAPALEEILNSAKLEGILMNTMTINELSNWESATLEEMIHEILALLDKEIEDDLNSAP